MSIGYALGNLLLAPVHYKNWPEVIMSVVKRQEPAKVILKNGVQIEAATDLKFWVRDIYIGQPYTCFFPIDEHDIVVDIGANNGMFTLFAASKTDNSIHAFEPAPNNFKFLERNIRTNGLSTVVAHNVAVSDTIGTTKLFLHPNCHGGNVLFDPMIPDKLSKHVMLDSVSADKLEEYVEVPTTTLQDIMDSNNLERIDFLKLDCEGSEGTILPATPKEYLGRIKKIALEFHDELSQFDHDALQKLLEEAGFTTRLKWGGKIPFGYLYAWRV